MTKNSLAGNTTPTTKRARTIDGLVLPSDDEIGTMTTKDLRAWCKKLGVAGSGKKQSAKVLRLLLFEHIGEKAQNAPQDMAVDHNKAECSIPPRRPPPMAPPTAVWSEDWKEKPPSEDGNVCLRALDNLSSVTREIDEILGDYENGRSKLELTKRLLDSFVDGLRFAVTSNPNAFATQTEASQKQTPQTTSKSWKQVVTSGLSKTPPKGTDQRKQEARLHKKNALSRLREMKSFTMDSSRQAIWEPEVDGYRKMNFSIASFRRQVEEFFEATFGFKDTVEFCKRLERGGTRIQLSEEAWTCANNPNVKLITSSYGTWILNNEERSSPSIVIEDVDTRLPDSFVIEELAVHNQCVHKLTPDEIRDSVYKFERLQYRDNTTKELKNSRKIRMFCTKKIADLLLECGGIFIAGIPVHVRAYNRPLVRCYNCGKLGSHRSKHCRAKSLCRHCGGSHPSNICEKRSKDLSDKAENSQEEKPNDWDEINEEELSHLKTQRTK